MLEKLRFLISRFQRDESASLTVEVVMVLPILLWGYFGMFVLFEGYRNISANINASYAIADMLSRETDPVDAAYIAGLNKIQDVLTQSPQSTGLRISVVQFDDNDTPNNTNDDFYTLLWSHGTGGPSDVTQATMNSELVPYLPGMYDGEQLITVETYMYFAPFFDISLSDLITGYGAGGQNDKTVFGPFMFESISVTRPRFAGQLCWQTCSNS